MQATVLLILTVVGIWLLVLTYFLISAINHYQRLTRGTNRENLKVLLENIVKSQGANESRFAQISKELAQLENRQKNFFQKFGLIRFNPYEQTGGDQSFTVALLNGDNNGIVISSLHSRESTRVYAKEITNGKSARHQFSKEEKEVVDKTAHQD